MALEQSGGAPEVLPTDTAELFQRAVTRAVELLRGDEIVALPTETVYGLAANALSQKAVAKIFEAKGRPSHNPIIVHVASVSMARQCAADWPESAAKLADAFWPGPLTMVLPKAPQIPDVVTAGGSTVGIRWPSHPLIQEVIRQCGFPLAAPSANSSNFLSPTTAEHVARDLGRRIPLIVDGGQSQVGIESAVVDLVSSPPRLLRPGMIHEGALASVLGRLAVGHGEDEKVLRSPGMLPRHYSPKARLVVWEWRSDQELAARCRNSGVLPGDLHLLVHTRIPQLENVAQLAVIPHDPLAFARALYGQLHACDRAGAKLIVVEKVPERAEWRGIKDRLERASRPR